jgi:ribonuclease III
MADETKIESNEHYYHESPDNFIQRLKLPITDSMLLTRALTHRSYLNENPEALEDNERLEFLGDAVLDFVVGAWLYHRYPEMPEGDLTRMRSALVYTEQLAIFARNISLGNAMRLGRGEAQSGGRTRDALLCDTFEAVIGALFINAGIGQVITFIEPMLASVADDVLINHKIEDPKSLFQEWSQAHLGYTPQYVTRNASGPDHSRVFEIDVVVNGQVYGSGQGRSKQAATKEAALDAIQRYNIKN